MLIDGSPDGFILTKQFSKKTRPFSMYSLPAVLRPKKANIATTKVEMANRLGGFEIERRRQSKSHPLRLKCDHAVECNQTKEGYPGYPYRIVRFATGVVGEPFTTYGVRLYDWPQRKALYTFIGHVGPVTALRFSPVGTYLASGAQDTSVLLWDLTRLPGGK